MASEASVYPKKVIVVRRVSTTSGAHDTAASTLPTSDTEKRHSHHIKVANPAIRVMVLPDVRSRCVPNKFFNEEGKSRGPPSPHPPRGSLYGAIKLKVPVHDLLPPPIPPRLNQEAVQGAPSKTNPTDDVRMHPSSPVSKQNVVESDTSNIPASTEKPANSMNDVEPPRPVGLYRTKGNIPCYSPSANKHNTFCCPCVAQKATVPHPPSNEDAVSSLPSNGSLKQEPEPLETHTYDVQSPARYAQPGFRHGVCVFSPSPKRWTQEGVYNVPPSPIKVDRQVYDVLPTPKQVDKGVYDVPPSPRPVEPWKQAGVYDVPGKRPTRPQPPKTPVKEPEKPTACDVPRTTGMTPPWTKEGVYDVPPIPKPAKPWTQEGVYDVPKSRPPRPPPPPPLKKSSWFEKTEQNVPSLPPRVRLDNIQDNTSLNTANTSLNTAKTSTDVLNSIIDSSKITELNRNTFKDFLSTRDAAVVMFYNPTDRKFQHFKDQFDQASRTTFHHNHAFASVDCSREKDLCHHEHIISFPAFKLYNSGVTMKTIQGSVLKTFYGGTMISAAKIQEYIDKHSYS